MIKEFDAIISEFDNIVAFIEEELEKAEVSMKLISQFDICVDEIFTNISSYAYDSSPGKTQIMIEVLDNPDRVEITFSDQGKVFNPLEHKDPDITLNAEEREIGGLGIFMVKKLMDDVIYERKDGNNILKISKLI